jgi:XTP/dITP diphosphohydrolase
VAGRGDPGADLRAVAPVDAALTQAAGSAFAELVAVMDRLRSPGGCPWDAEQTHASLAPYAIEEAYEVAEAAERGDAQDLREELGDLLLQVVFHARVAEEDATEAFDVADVIRGLVEKLIRRHPHVFGDLVVSGAAEVNANWDRIKGEEKTRDGLLDGVPLALPALVRAQKAMSRARRVGTAVPDRPADGAPLGDRILGLVAEAAESGLDAEAEVRRALDRWLRAVDHPVDEE